VYWFGHTVIEARTENQTRRTARSLDRIVQASLLGSQNDPVGQSHIEVAPGALLSVNRIRLTGGDG
jgi:hypothetical protein